MTLHYAIEKIQSCDDIKISKSIANSVNRNQIRNKKWLVKHLKPYLDMYTNPKIVVAAGWYGLTAHLIDREVISFDMDPICANIKLFPNVKYKTKTIENFDPSSFDVIICTSCEHITDKALNNFLSRKSPTSIAVLQSNDYYSIKDHINCKKSCEDFAKSLNLNIINKFTLKFDNYNRFMIFAL